MQRLTRRAAGSRLARVTGRDGEGRQGSGLVVQRLDDELLVYDTASDEAHCLGPAAAAEFEAAADEVSRREVLRKMALAGAAAAGSAALVKTIVAPTPAMAQSTACGTGTCPLGTSCCSDPGVAPACCIPGQTCCGPGIGLCCTDATHICFGPPPGHCEPCGATAQPCCPLNTCSAGLICTAGICAPASDRNLKRDLEPVEPQAVLRLL